MTSVPLQARALDPDGADGVSARTSRRLGDLLVDRGVLTATSLAKALASRDSAPPNRRRLGHLLVDRGLATEEQIARTLAELLGLDFDPLVPSTVSDDLVRRLPQAVAEAHGLVVLALDESTVTVATADPKNVVGLDDARLHTESARVRVVVAPESAVRDALARAYGRHEVRAIESGITPEDDVDDGIAQAEDAPIVRLAGRILAEAIRGGASDIHLEPHASGLRVRTRVDGVLRKVREVPLSMRAPLTSRLKLISGMDIAERRVPQDGRVRLTIGGDEIDARVSSLPSLHGEKIVIRILASALSVPPLGDLGLRPRDEAVLRDAVSRSQGLVLITGPTGSGKTSTLFSVLREINGVERNIVTLEDPVEIELPGLTQVQVNERTGLTFAAGLRSILRQDPDVVLVGEIRDLETAALAMRASMTGHLVLATLHTNDASSALTRLVDMGVEPYAVASALTVVVAQRLVRTLCQKCAALGVPVGCPYCDDSGYRGRAGVFEVIEVTRGIHTLMLDGASAPEIARQATTEGTLGLRGAAMELVAAGRTDQAEVVRATVVADAESLTSSAGSAPASAAT